MAWHAMSLHACSIGRLDVWVGGKSGCVPRVLFGPPSAKPNALTGSFVKMREPVLAIVLTKGSTDLAQVCTSMNQARSDPNTPHGPQATRTASSSSISSNKKNQLASPGIIGGV